MNWSASSAPHSERPQGPRPRKLAGPLHARAASDNAGSLRVLQKAGFKIIGTGTSFASGRNREIEETILRLDT